MTDLRSRFRQLVHRTSAAMAIPRKSIFIPPVRSVADRVVALRCRRVRLLGSLVAALLAALFGGLGSAATANASETDCTSSGYSCTPGYTGANASATWSWRYYGGSFAATPTGYHNCTLYAAWRLAQNGMADPGRSWGNAVQWASSIGGGNHTPAPGSIAWWGAERAGGLGHVA